MHTIKKYFSSLFSETYRLPLSIVFGSCIIALSILLHGVILSRGAGQSNTGFIVDKKKVLAVQDRPVVGRYFTGSPVQESVQLHEYSDTECPFCKMFHETTLRLLETFPSKIALVYHHFPLSFHPNAQKQAEAIECIRESDGDARAFQFVDAIFAVTPSNNKLPDTALFQIAKLLDLDTKNLATCLEEGRYTQRVLDQENDGREKGVTGTPYTFIVQKDGENIKNITEINGAQTFETVGAIIESILK